MDGMRFEWDPVKDEINQRKHGISFSDAVQVFSDRQARTYYDDRHSFEGEEREITIGMLGAGPIIVVVHVDRSNTVRLISARKATPRERRTYHSDD